MGRTRRKRLKKKLRNSLDHEAEVINLRKFMTRNGFNDEINLKLRNFPETGRGVATVKTLHANDVIIRVPYNLMVTYTTLQSGKFPQLFTSSSKLTIHDLLAAFLVMERHKKQSFWSSYVSSLPPKPPWIPSLLSVEYIELLPADLRLAAKKSRRLLEESWSRIKKSIKRDWTCSCCGKRADCVIDLNTFTWGYILVNTRAVYVNPEIVRESCGSCEDILSDQPCMALCPYLDMFNHSHTARTRAELIRREGRLVYQLTALNSTKKHQQVFISYGAHDNVKLLTEYGFFIPGNRFDSIQIRSEDVLKVLNLNLNDSQYKFIRTHGLDKSDLYIGEGGPSFNLKAFLFVAFKDSTAKNFASIIYSDSYPKHFLEGIADSCRKLLYLHLELTEKALRTFQDLASIDSERDVSVIIDFLKYRREFVKVLCDNKQ